MSANLGKDELKNRYYNDRIDEYLSGDDISNSASTSKSDSNRSDSLAIIGDYSDDIITDSDSDRQSVIVLSSNGEDTALEGTEPELNGEKGFEVSKYFKPKTQKIKQLNDRRRDIKTILSDRELGNQTRRARRAETERFQRLQKRRNKYSPSGHFEFDDYTNDLLNKPEDNGRVLVNVGHSVKESPIYLSKLMSLSVKPHQIGGIRFLFDNVIDSSAEFGCILSHSMGLGKTLQIIAIIDVFMALPQNDDTPKVLIVVPVNVINNWIQEFDKWVPNRYFEVFSIKKSALKARNKVLKSWSESGGVLLIGYEKYMKMCSEIKNKFDNEFELGSDDIRMAKHMKACLVKPGPDLVVCDEGHRIKNNETGISGALKQIGTKRRIILTGYPLQNRLKEYYCMIDFVRPNYLGLQWEFNNTFGTPIANGQCSDATEADKKMMRERSHVLNRLLEGFIQRRSEEVLATSLPPKLEFVLYCKMSSKQRELMFEFINSCLNDQKLKDINGKISLFKTFVICSKICSHPDIIDNILQKGLNYDNDSDLELDPDLNKEIISYSWAKDSLEYYESGILENSNKMIVLFEIIAETIRNGDKLLVFSQWLFTLDLIERFLEFRTIPNSRNKWRKNENYYRLDGQTSADEREKLINCFNDVEGRAHLFLISTKAGGIGVNLIGANRIVIFDACWNPCHDAQAACRVYRYGQSKPTYIYCLISDNSLEKRVFNKQIFKQGMANRVIDRKNIVLSLKSNEIRALLVELKKELEETNDSNEMNSTKINKLSDSLLQSICLNPKSSHCLTTVPFIRGELLEKLELDLTADQKQMAFEKFREIERSIASLKPNYQNIDSNVDSDVDDLTDRFKFDFK